MAASYAMPAAGYAVAPVPAPVSYTRNKKVHEDNVSM